MARNALVFFVIGVSFFDTLAQLPIVAPYARHLGAGTTLVGLTVAAYSLANMVGNILAGPVIDRRGRKASMVTGMLIAAAGVLLAAAASAPGHFLGARIVHGLGGAILVPAAFAYVGDRTGASRAGGAVGMAKSGIAIGVAALLGPPLAGILKDRAGFDAVFVFVGLLLVVTALVVRVLLEEPGLRARPTPSLGDFAAYRRFLDRPVYAGAVTAVFCLTFGKGILAFALPLRGDALGYGAAPVGVLMSGFAFSAILVFALGRRLGGVSLETRVLGGLGVMGLSLGLLDGLTSYWALMSVMLAYGVGFGLLFPAAAAQVVSVTSEEDRGRAFGLYYAAFSLGIVAGPVVSSLLHVWTGLSPFLCGAAALLAGVPLAASAYARVPAHEPTTGASR